MDRKTFLGRFGMGVAGIILAPSIVKSSFTDQPITTSLIRPDILKWNSNEIFIRINNNNPEPTKVMLFGSKVDITDNHIPSGIKIQVAGSSYEHLSKYLLCNDVKIHGFKIKAQKRYQLSEDLNIYHLSESGKMSINWFTPAAYLSAQSPDYTIMEVPQFELLLTPLTYLMTTINANEQVDYIFTIEKFRVKVNNQSSTNEYL